MEAQIANLADEIAYNNHDIDDGFRAGIFGIDELCNIEIFRIHHQKVTQQYHEAEARIQVNETVRLMINHLITDVIAESQQRIQLYGIETLADVRKCVKPLVGFSQPLKKLNGEMKKFLYHRMYKHYRVVRMATKAEQVIKKLFEAYMQTPAMLPDSIFHSKNRPDHTSARVIADYIAGMTDRYALDEFDRLFNIHTRT
ncbi:MAG: hypothetical protein R8M38_08685 [Mariprofundaceae bacterium]